MDILNVDIIKCVYIYTIWYTIFKQQLDYHIYIYIHIYYRNMDTAYIVVVYMYDKYMY